MLPVLIFIHVLLILCAFGLAIGNGSGGQHNCPCLEDVPPLTQEDEIIAESFGINITDYGIGKQREIIVSLCKFYITHIILMLTFLISFFAVNFCNRVQQTRFQVSSLQWYK